MSKRTNDSDSNGLLVLVVSTVGSVVAASVARKSLRLAWRGVTGQAPPDDPKARDTDWVVALTWAMASGAAIGVARMVAERELVGRLKSD